MLDLGLPGSMGTESLAAIRQANDQLPIVVLTGLNDEHTAWETLAQGAQDYLVRAITETCG
jgi:DNA-binding response OmpR family regulator